jgi:D-tyrosyl-tRNA(Tyr) deacylase
VRAVLQRVRRAAVSWSGGNREVGPGLCVLLGVGPNDDEHTAERLAEKVAQLRIFRDEHGKTNRSLQDVSGEALVVSQFTLYADTSRGRRPSFIGAAPPEHADRLYRHFANCLATSHHVPTKTGEFGAEMVVEIENDGPVTLVLDTEETNAASSRHGATASPRRSQVRPRRPNRRER